MSDLSRPRRTLRSPRNGSRPRREPAPARGFLVVSAIVIALALGVGVAVGPQVASELQRLARSRAFRVRSVAVVGAQRVSPTTIVDVAGISGGSALLDVDVEAVAARVSALPEVASARALRLPPGRVVVGVTERVAHGVAAAGPGGSPHLVCNEGVAFAPALGREALRLPRLAAPGRPQIGEADAGLAQAAQVAAAAAALGFAVAGVEMDGADTDLQLNGLSARVRLGPAPHAQALARLVQLVARRPDLVGSATLIDVRFADRVVLRSDEAPKGAQQEATTRGFAPASREPAAG